MNGRTASSQPRTTKTMQRHTTESASKTAILMTALLTPHNACAKMR